MWERGPARGSSQAHAICGGEAPFCLGAGPGRTHADPFNPNQHLCSTSVAPL